MISCPRCGAPIAQGSNHCTKCGFSIVYGTRQGAANNGGAFVDKVAAFFKKLNNTTDYTFQCAPDDAAKNQVFGILAYIPLFFLIPYLTAKQSRFAQFHANQGLLSTIVFFGIGLVNAIIDIIIKLIFGIGSISFFVVIGNIICWVIGTVSSAVFLYFMFMGIINAAKHTLKELPIIGSFRILK